MILKPLVLDPCLRGESIYLNTNKDAGFGEPWGRSRRSGSSTSNGACAEAAEVHPLWPVSQHSSRPPREDQIAFLLVLSHPMEVGSGWLGRQLWGFGEGF